jgi:hypothetical protein
MPISMSDPFDPARDAGLAAEFAALSAAGKAPHALSPRGRQLREAWARHELRRSGASAKKLQKFVKQQWAYSKTNRPGTPSGDGRGDLAGPRYDAVVSNTIGHLPKNAVPAAGQDNPYDTRVSAASDSLEKARRALVAYELMRNPETRAALVSMKATVRKGKAGKAALKEVSAILGNGRMAKSSAPAGDSALTEFEELDPDRVDGVATPANGVPFLMLKSLGQR